MTLNGTKVDSTLFEWNSHPRFARFDSIRPRVVRPWILEYHPWMAVQRAEFEGIMVAPQTNRRNTQTYKLDQDTEHRHGCDSYHCLPVYDNAEVVRPWILEDHSLVLHETAFEGFMVVIPFMHASPCPKKNRHRFEPPSSCSRRVVCVSNRLGVRIVWPLEQCLPGHFPDVFGQAKGKNMNEIRGSWRKALEEFVWRVEEARQKRTFGYYCMTP